MGDILSMSKKERKIFVELMLVKEGKQKLIDVSVRLGKSYRQVRRIFQCFLKEGENGLIPITKRNHVVSQDKKQMDIIKSFVNEFNANTPFSNISSRSLNTRPARNFPFKYSHIFSIGFN